MELKNDRFAMKGLLKGVQVSSHSISFICPNFTCPEISTKTSFPREVWPPQLRGEQLRSPAPGGAPLRSFQKSQNQAGRFYG